MIPAPLPGRAARRIVPWAFFLLLAAQVLAAPPLSAQGLGGLAEGDEPLEVTAEEGIEWYREERIYIARGNARAVSGTTEVFADLLKAHYREAETGGSEIYLIEAVGAVRIETPSEIVYGDQAQYILDQEVVVLRGRDLKFVSRDGRDTITARDSLEYWRGREIAVARGDAQAVHEDKQINADVLVAHFEAEEGDKQDVRQVDADGNVRLRTPTDFVVGDKGIYYVKQELARLQGDVKITRDNNQLNGEYAEVNLATGVSKLLGSAPGDAKTKGRVDALILPKAKPKKKADTE